MLRAYVSEINKNKNKLRWIKYYDGCIMQIGAIIDIS